MKVLDTNIIIDNTVALFDENVAIPFEVLGELNKLKSSSGTKGYKARKAMKAIFNNIVIGDNNKKINIIIKDPIEDYIKRGLGIGDFEVINAASEQDDHVVRTSDQAVAIVSKLIGLTVEYVRQEIDLYCGYTERFFEPDIVNSIAKGDIIKVPNICYNMTSVDGDNAEFVSINIGKDTFMSNQYIKLIDISNPKHCTYARYNSKDKVLFPVKYKSRAFGIEPMSKNIGQTVFMDALLNPDIKILTVNSEAGAGKSLLALAAAVEQVAGKSAIYDKCYVFRALEAVSEEIGFLPGDADDKVDRWHDSLYDSFEVLLNRNKIVKKGEQVTRELMKSKLHEYKVEIGVLTFIRGRSLENSFIIIDEAQNVTPDVMRTIVTRCAANTKLIILGDPSQIDNPKCRKDYNGLTHVINSLHNKSLPQYAHVELDKCERSDIAEIGIKYL